MDDSASALDFATDARLRKAIKEDTRNMTVFLVSQRAATVKHADRILVLDRRKAGRSWNPADIPILRRLSGNLYCPSYQKRRCSSMRSKKNQETLKRILIYIRQYKWQVGISLALALVIVALTLYVPILIGQAVDVIVSQENVDFSRLTEILEKIGVSVGVTALAQWLMNHINNKITYQVVMDIRTQAFERLEHLPISYLTAILPGDVLSRVITDVDQFSEGLLMGFNYLREL